MSPSNPWIKFSERAPTEVDADSFGCIMVMFGNKSVAIHYYYNDQTKYLNKPLMWASIPKLPEPTRDDRDKQEYDRFIKTYSLHCSMVNSLNLKLAYEAGLREARKQAREAFDKVICQIDPDQKEAAEAFAASIQA